MRRALGDGPLALLVGFDVVAIVGSLPALATDRWFRPRLRSLASMARFSLMAVLMPRVLLGFAGDWCSSRALLGSFRVDDGEPQPPDNKSCMLNIAITLDSLIST